MIKSYIVVRTIDKDYIIKELKKELEHYNWSNPVIAHFETSHIFNDLVNEVKEGISSLDYMKKEIHKVISYELETFKNEV